MRKAVKRIIGSILQVGFSFCKIQSNKIMFETCTGEVKDQVKAFYDYMNDNHKGEYEFKWAIKKGNDESAIKPEEVVYKKTWNYYYQLMTSRYWMRTHSIECMLKKREGQIYIQLWHGPGATKKEGYDVKGVKNTGEVMPHAKEWDYYIATDPISQAYIKTALNLKVPRILLGSCRTDTLVNMPADRYGEIRKKLGISENEKAVLYAPTFRENDFNLDKVELRIKKLAKLDGIRVILRLHPEIKNKLNMSEYDSSVIDGNVYPDIYDLYMAADILVTDYSSVSIEYSLLRRPILYYMYDLEEYIEERDFYFDYLDHLSGPIIQTEEELIEAVLNINQVHETYYLQYEEYYQRYNQKNDGHVCERLYQLLKEGYFEKNLQRNE